MTQEEMKKAVAIAALEFIEDNTFVGVGTGSTANHFMENLAKIKHRIEGAVASSKITEERLKALNIPVFDLNSVPELGVYVDGADACNIHRQLVKGGGGALTREKILAAACKQFVCIVDETKKVEIFGEFPVPIEVIPMARSYVGREIVALGGDPVYREDFVTDNGNVILDVHNWVISEPIKLERSLNNIVGVVTNGLFADRPADILLISTKKGMSVFKGNVSFS